MPDRNNALLGLNRVVVRGNAASVFGPAGVEQGGGIWSDVLLTGPPVRLTLWHSLVTQTCCPRSRASCRCFIDRHETM